MGQTDSAHAQALDWHFLKDLRVSTGVANDGGLYEQPLRDTEDDGSPAEDRTYEIHYLGETQVNTNAHQVWRKNGTAVSVKPQAWTFLDGVQMIYGEIEGDAKGECLVFSTDEIGKFVERDDVAPPA